MNDLNIIYILEKNSKLDLNYDIDKNTIIYNYSVNTSLNININLVCEGVFVKYYCNVINYDNNIHHVIVKHLVSNTCSYIYCHGVNVDNNSLLFYIDGVIPKGSNKSTNYQDSQIINIKFGKSKIYPNLLIDEFDTSSSHSSYIGKLKDEYMFYLNSVGINNKDAKHLLLYAFLNNTDSIDNDKIDFFLEEIDRI